MRVVAVLVSLAVLAFATVAFLFYRGTVRFNTPSCEDFPVRGIDVSHHQGPIDWIRVKSAGVGFAFIKATEGGDWQDPAFERNWQDAAAAGVPRGAYHFFTLCRPGADQAANFIQALQSLQTTAPGAELPPVIDLEFGGNCGSRPTSEEFFAELNAFFGAVQASDAREPVLYVTYEFLEAYLHGMPTSHRLWIRDIFWKPSIPEAGRWLFWQHHNRARVEGIVGPVDLNVFAGSDAAFARYLASDALPWKE